MKPNRLDDIFQVKNGIPIIAGLFIGMDGYEAEEILEELTYYTVRHSYEYPADLIYQMKIDFGYELFMDSETVKTISITFAGKGTTRDVSFIKDYIQNKYYHERVDEYLQKDAEGNILGYMIEIYNDYYQFTICSKDEGVMAIFLRATCSESDYYDAFNIVSEQTNLKNFIKQSLYLLDKDAKSREWIEEIMPIRYGLPSFLGCFLGDILSFGTSSGKLEEWTNDEFDGIPMKEDYGISYEYDLDELNRVIEIDLALPPDSEGVWPIINYLKKNMIINVSQLDVKNDKNGYPAKVRGFMQNEFISIVLFEPTYEDNGYTHLSISVRDEDNIKLFSALRIIFYNERIFKFFEGLENFYADGKDTQDAKFNDVRKTFDSFEDFLNDYIAKKAAYELDMRDDAREEYELNRKICLEAWNTPERCL